MGTMVEVWGKYALFTRPEMKVERVSYDVMTPSAARGLLEAVLWHPGLKWVIDRIYVLAPIAFTNIRRNEVSATLSAANALSAMNGRPAELYITTKDCIQQRAATVLQDVHYVIEAHFVMTDKAAPGDNPGKFCEMMRRRLEKGQCYHQPYLGTREFPACFRPWKGGTPVTAYPEEDRELGFMLYDMDYSDPEDIRSQFFRAKLCRGVLDLRDVEVYT
ncbi:MAG: type I-C CRISPR-associated protein Cas5 [Oscillospiraceae bacterium]|nr:type I-C CRISPR-associated protein Cas5 [Oscillospiraceae bacterium]